MALPATPDFDPIDRRRRTLRWCVVMAVVPGNHTVPVEIERAPDSGGSPGTYIQIASLPSVPKQGVFYVDERPGDGATWWYRARHGAGSLYGSAGSYATAVSAVARLVHERDLRTQEIASTPFSRVDDIGSSAITEPKVSNLAITEGKIASDAVSTAKVQNAAITTPKVSQGSCKIGRTTAQTIANNTLTTIAFDSEFYDAEGMFTAASDDEIITLPRAGKVVVVAQVSFASNSTGYRYADIVVGGSVVAQVQLPPATGVPTRVLLTGVADVAANDTVSLRVQQTSGGDLDVQATLVDLAAHYITT